MTVTLESVPALATPHDRRTSIRFKPAHPLVAIVGRGTGSVIDISLSGARIRHDRAVARGARARIAFDWNGGRFEATAEVLGSRVAGIEGKGTLFESRIRFLSFVGSSAELLERMRESVAKADLRKWVANLRGWNDEEDSSPQATPPPNFFLQCRYVGGFWRHKLSRDSSAPADGFTIAAGTERSEISALCRTYESSDAEGRRLLQLFASAVLQQDRR